MDRKRKLEILEVTQEGITLTTEFIEKEARCSITLKNATDGVEKNFSIIFRADYYEMKMYADFSSWLMTLINDEDGRPLKAMEVDGRIAAIGKGDDCENDWFLSYTTGGGHHTTAFPEYLINNISQIQRC